MSRVPISTSIPSPFRALLVFGLLAAVSVVPAVDSQETVRTYWLVAGPVGLALCAALYPAGERRTVLIGICVVLAVNVVVAALGGDIATVDTALGLTIAVLGAVTASRALAAAGLSMAVAAFALAVIDPADLVPLVASVAAASLLLGAWIAAASADSPEQAH